MVQEVDPFYRLGGRSGGAPKEGTWVRFAKGFMKNREMCYIQLIRNIPGGVQAEDMMVALFPPLSRKVPIFVSDEEDS